MLKVSQAARKSGVQSFDNFCKTQIHFVSNVANLGIEIKLNDRLEKEKRKLQIFVLSGKQTNHNSARKEISLLSQFSRFFSTSSARKNVL